MAVTHSTTVVVADDGTSPVGTDEWNADHVVAGSYLGYNTIGGSQSTGGTTNYAKKITVPSGGKVLLSIGAYVNMDSLASTTIDVGIFADSAGAPTGQFLAWNRAGSDSYGSIIGVATVGSWLDIPCATQLAAGDYWIYWGFAFQGAFWRLYYDGSGTDKELTPNDGISFAEAIPSQTIASASRKYSIRALVL